MALVCIPVSAAGLLKSQLWKQEGPPQPGGKGEADLGGDVAPGSVLAMGLVIILANLTDILLQKIYFGQNFEQPSFVCYVTS